MSEHLRCEAPLPGRPGRTCRQTAGKRTDHPGVGRCWCHGGLQESPTSRKVVADRTRVLAAEMSRLGLPVPTDPAAGLADQIAASVGHVTWLRTELEQLVGQSGVDGLVRGVKSVTRRQGTAMAPNGLLQPVDETTTVVGPGVHTLWTLYQQERAHLSRLLVAAVGAGLAERQTALDEERGQLLAKLLIAAVGDLGLSEEQRARVPGAIRAHLSILKEPS